MLGPASSDGQHRDGTCLAFRSGEDGARAAGIFAKRTIAGHQAYASWYSS